MSIYSGQKLGHSILLCLSPRLPVLAFLMSFSSRRCCCHFLSMAAAHSWNCNSIQNERVHWHWWLQICAKWRMVLGAAEYEPMVVVAWSIVCHWAHSTNPTKQRRNKKSHDGFPLLHNDHDADTAIAQPAPAACHSYESLPCCSPCEHRHARAPCSITHCETWVHRRRHPDSCACSWLVTGHGVGGRRDVPASFTRGSVGTLAACSGCKCIHIMWSY